jgi:hypothetical protein
MNRVTTVALSAAVSLCVGASAAMAQSAPPTYQADPDVYKACAASARLETIPSSFLTQVGSKFTEHPAEPDFRHARLPGRPLPPCDDTRDQDALTIQHEWRKSGSH